MDANVDSEFLIQDPPRAFHIDEYFLFDHLKKMEL